MLGQLERTLENKAPGIADAYRAIRNRWTFGRRFGVLQRRLRRTLYGHEEIAVLSGPFRGLKYINAIVWGSITPKWLGAYEAELSRVVEEIVERTYAQIVDVGCAEGYYAAGLALRCPRARIHAYDTDFISRRQARRLARLNRLEDRVRIMRRCSGADLSRLAGARTLVICDIEGAERALLDPAGCPALRSMDILVEVHEGEWESPTAELLKGRFRATHAIEEISSVTRERWIDSSALAASLALNREQLRAAADEHRTNGRLWLWMKTTAPAPTPAPAAQPPRGP